MRLAIVALALLATTPARAQTAPAGPPRDVSAAQVCQVQSAIRWQERAWDVATCERVATALNATPDPVTMLAVCINESDLRPTAIDVVRPDVYDAGLCGVRCHVVGGKCADGPARGMALQQLFEPATNVAIAANVMAEKRAKLGRHYLRGYNGGTREHGYAERIGAIAAALGGVRVATKCKRVRRLVELIVAAVAPKSRIDCARTPRYEGGFP